MKIYIIGNNKKDNSYLSSKLSEIYNINKFNTSALSLEEINKIIRENKEWILESEYNDNSNVIASVATTVIYLNINKTSFVKKRVLDNNDIKELIRKYPSKVLIIKSNKEISKFIAAIYKGIEL